VTGQSQIWFNGRLVPAAEAVVPVTAHALHYGSSVFEGIRAYDTGQGAAIFCLPQHVRRLFDSCRMLRIELPYSPLEITDAIAETVRANGHDSCYIRPLVFRGPGTFSLDPRKASVEVAIITFPWGRYLGQDAVEQGVDVMVSSWRRAAPGTAVPMGKIGGQYVTSQFIAMEARTLGARRVVIGHHDDWMPPITAPDFDMGPVRAELAKEAPEAALLEPGYLEAVEL